MGIVNNLIRRMVVKSFKGSSFQSLSNSNSYNVLNGWSSDIKRTEDETLLEQGYVTNAHVYSIVRLISSKGSVIPIDIFEGEDLVEDGVAYDVVNPVGISKEDFIEHSFTYLLTTGDLFYYAPKIRTLNGTGIELEILNSGGVTINVTNSGEIKNYEYNDQFKTRKFAPEEIIHIKYCDPTLYGLSSKRGLSPLQAGYRTMTASNENLTAMASVWANKGVSGLLTSNTDETLSPEEAKGVQDAVNNKLGGSHKANGVAATTANVRFEQIGMSGSDMELLQSSPQLLRGICMLYGVDPALLGDPESRKYSNLKEAEKSLFVRSAIPDNERLISYLMRFVVPAWSLLEGKDYIIKQDLDKIEALQPDKKVQAEKNKIISESLTALLSSNLSAESKEILLIDIHNIEPDKANTLAYGIIE